LRAPATISNPDFNVITAGHGRNRNPFEDGGLLLGKKKSADDRNVFYALPRPTIIHSPATPGSATAICVVVVAA
jgi:hypothetical protein